MGAYDFLFQGNSDASQTTSGTPGAWDPDLKALWDEYLGAWQDYQSQTQARADYQSGVNADYAARMGAAQDQYTRPALTVSIGGRPLEIVPKRNLTALELLGNQYGSERTAALETPPNQGFFDYIEALAPQAWRGMQNRYALPTQTQTGELSNTPSALEVIGQLARIGYTGSQLWSLFGGKNDAIDQALNNYFGDLDLAAATTVPDAGDVITATPDASGVYTPTGGGGGSIDPLTIAPASGAASELAGITGSDAAVDAALGEYFAPLDAAGTNLGVDAALNGFFAPLDATATNLGVDAALTDFFGPIDAAAEGIYGAGSGAGLMQGIGAAAPWVAGALAPIAAEPIIRALFGRDEVPGYGPKTFLDARAALDSGTWDQFTAQPGNNGLQLRDNRYLYVAPTGDWVDLYDDRLMNSIRRASLSPGRLSGAAREAAFTNYMT